MKTSQPPRQSQVQRTNLQLESFEQRLLMAADLDQIPAQEHLSDDNSSTLMVAVLAGSVQEAEAAAVAYPLPLGVWQPTELEIFLRTAGNGNVEPELLDEIAQDVAASLPRLPGPELGKQVVSELQNLLSHEGHASLKFGNYFEAEVETSIDANTGKITLTFTNVRMNLGKFAGDFLNGITSSLQAYTGKLDGLANTITRPLLNFDWIKPISMIDVLRDFGYADEAKRLQTFADTIHAINGLESIAGSNGWVELGGFTANASSAGAPLSITKFAVDSDATEGIADQLGDFADSIRSLQNIAGVSLSLDNPRELLRLLAGEATDLFRYQLDFEVNLQNFSQMLASIPIFPVALTSVDLSVGGSIDLQAGATFGFDSSGFQSGKIADGFFVEDAELSGTVNFGLAGTLNVSYLVGYRVTGAVHGDVGLEWQSGRSDRIYLLQSGGGNSLVVSNSVTNDIDSKVVGTDEMLGQLAKVIGNLGQKAINEIAKALSMENLNALVGRLPNAGKFLTQLESSLLAAKIGDLSANHLSSLVVALPSNRFSEVFGSLDARDIQSTLEKLNWEQCGDIAQHLDGKKLGRFLNEIPSTSMHKLMNTMKGSALINIAEELSSSALGKALSKLDARQLKEVVRDLSPRIVAKALNEAPSKIYGEVAKILGSDSKLLGNIMDRLDGGSLKEFSKQLSKAQANAVINHIGGEAKKLFEKARGISVNNAKSWFGL